MAKSPRARPSLTGVAAADRVLKVLTAFRSGDRALQLTELAARTGLVKSTIMRLAISLQECGLILRLGDGSYRLDAEVLRLGAIYQNSLDLASHVLPILEHLVDETEESASFYVRRGSRRLCLFRVDSPHLLRMHVYPGMFLPMDQSAIAKVLRDYGKGKEDATEGGVPIYTTGATDPHTASAAAPVFRADGALVGALALSGPTTRLTPERLRNINKVLLKAAQRLTKSLGGSSLRAKASDN